MKCTKGWEIVSRLNLMNYFILLFKRSSPGVSLEHSLLTGHPDQIDSSLVTADYKRFCDSDFCDSDFWDSEVNVILCLGFLPAHLRLLLACLLSEISFPALVVI